MLEGKTNLFLKRFSCFDSIIILIITVGNPETTDPPWAVESPILAAGIPPIITDEDPFTILSGGPTQTRIDPTVAAGKPPIRTVGTP